MPRYQHFAFLVLPMVPLVLGFSAPATHKWLPVCADTKPRQLQNGDSLMNIDTNLAEQLAASGGTSREFPVIITLQRSEDLPLVLGQGIRPSLTYQSIPAFAASLTGEQIEAIAKMPQVKLIELDREAWALAPR